MSSVLQNICVLVGRLMLSAIFLLSGIHHLMDWKGATNLLAGQLRVWLRENLIEWLVPLLMGGALVFLIAGSVMVALGIRSRLGATMLLVFLLPTTILFHNFWSISPLLAEHGAQMIQFLKNLGLFGGLLMVVAFGTGKYSLEGALSIKVSRKGAARKEG